MQIMNKYPTIKLPGKSLFNDFHNNYSITFERLIRALISQGEIIMELVQGSQHNFLRQFQMYCRISQNLEQLWQAGNSFQSLAIMLP